MIVEKNGYVVIYTKDGITSLHDQLGQCIFRKTIMDMNREKAINIIEEFSRKGILTAC